MASIPVGPAPIRSNYKPECSQFCSSGAPFRYRTGHAKTCRFCAFKSGERAQENAFRSRDAQLFPVDFDPVGQRGKVIAAVAAAIDPQVTARCPGKFIPVDDCWQPQNICKNNRKSLGES
jgi:hypothetical protein